ncbi:ribonucleoside-diphosphate reductase [Lactobacillus phage 3-521]|uniref:Ribonucleoside-diphosphate reductase n=1 Tax=Lactobacillus phage 3-521 TaxID=2510943 RepID=A0A4Y5FGQ2_9CAUD|nr:ribonucleoside-diphosphate reductase [Lactobacillus phage 3-521]QBJ03668.1 ribonucleoside-diphosphate reductase [Lactobacillus phage 3-521]
MYNVTIYHTKGCMKCKQTAVLLRSNPKLQIKEVLVEQGTDLIEKLRGQGYRSMPVVLVKDAKGALVDSWNDFQVDKVVYWRNNR